MIRYKTTNKIIKDNNKMTLKGIYTNTQTNIIHTRVNNHPKFHNHHQTMLYSGRGRRKLVLAKKTNNFNKLVKFNGQKRTFQTVFECLRVF